MATITKGITFASGDVVTPTKLNNLVDAATVSNIQTADIADSQITAPKIANGAVTASKLDGISSINQKNANYTLILSDAGRVVEFNSASSLSISIPENSSVPFAAGTTIVVTRRGTGDVTISPAAGVTLRSADGRLKIAKQYAAAACMKIGSNEWLIVGNLKS